MPPPVVGLIGLGLMGAAFSERLRVAGFAVLGWDTDAERRHSHEAAGNPLATDAADLCARCTRTLLSLPHLGISEEVLAALPLRPGQLFLDTTTGDPAQTIALAGRVAAAGATYLDVCVSGSSTQLRAGEATLLIGGDTEAVAHNGDIFRALAQKIIHAGQAGDGAKLKLVTNLVLGLNRAALAEGLVLAGALGLDRNLAFEAMRQSAAYSRIMDSKGPKMLSGDFTPEARLSQHLKDVRLMLASGARLPLTEAHRALLERAEKLGFGALDNSAILKALEA